MFAKFQAWDEVIAHVRRGEPLYYWPPMDVRPTRVDAGHYRTQVVLKNDDRGNGVTVLRIEPPPREADPFEADADHLDRFRKREL